MQYSMIRAYRSSNGFSLVEGVDVENVSVHLDIDADGGARWIYERLGFERCRCSCSRVVKVWWCRYSYSYCNGSRTAIRGDDERKILIQGSDCHPVDINHR
jgi:hypothetical protein